MRASRDSRDNEPGGRSARAKGQKGKQGETFQRPHRQKTFVLVVKVRWQRYLCKQAMGEWKIQVSVRVSQALRIELEKYAAAEKRTLGNFGAVILEWAFEQLKAAGSTERLLKYKIRSATDRSKKS